MLEIDIDVCLCRRSLLPHVCVLCLVSVHLLCMCMCVRVRQARPMAKNMSKIGEENYTK